MFEIVINIETVLSHRFLLLDMDSSEKFGQTMHLFLRKADNSILPERVMGEVEGVSQYNWDGSAC